MNAIQLKFADGKPTGIWYCGKCREIFKSFCGNPDPEETFDRDKAEKCCTGKTEWVPATWKIGGKCTGCARPLKDCICGRAAKNRCVSCDSKLFQQEGRRVRWGTEIREVCYECSKNIPAAMLVDAAK